MLEQSEDKSLRPIVDRLMNQENHQDGKYSLYNIVLAKRKDLLQPFATTIAVRVAPEKLCGVLFAFYRLSRHIVHRKLFKQLSNYYYIKNDINKCKTF